jgi:antitoxin VapB
MLSIDLYWACADGYEARNQEDIMRTVSIFKNGNNRAIRLPRDLDFEG